MMFQRVGQFVSSLAADCIIVCHAKVICMTRGHLLQPRQSRSYNITPSMRGCCACRMAAKAKSVDEPRVPVGPVGAVKGRSRP